MTLAALQREFCDRILDDAVPDAARFGPDAQRRFGIYRNAYRARLIDCLRSSFDRSWSWIGDTAFDTAARQHAILNPPSSWTLDDYGIGFDVTLAALFPDDPEIAELAWLERAMQDAFGCADQAAISVEDAQAWIAGAGDIDTVRLTFVNSLRMTDIKTNCTDIWQAITDGIARPPSVQFNAGQHIRVWRKGLSPHFRICAVGEAQALHAMQKGMTFGALCAQFAEQDGSEAAVSRAGTFLGNWLGDELVAGLF